MHSIFEVVFQVLDEVLPDNVSLFNNWLLVFLGLNESCFYLRILDQVDGEVVDIAGDWIVPSLRQAVKTVLKSLFELQDEIWLQIQCCHHIKLLESLWESLQNKTVDCAICLRKSLLNELVD